MTARQELRQAATDLAGFKFQESTAHAWEYVSTVKVHKQMVLRNISKSHPPPRNAVDPQQRKGQGFDSTGFIYAECHTETTHAASQLQEKEQLSHVQDASQQGSSV